MKSTVNKAVPVVLLLIVLAFLIKDPAKAGHTASAVWDWLGRVGTAIGAFIDAL
jgi:hypothetical protein